MGVQKHVEAGGDMDAGGISWCHFTRNLWWGCSEVSPGCDNCYAREFAASRRVLGGMAWGPGTPRRTFGAAQAEHLPRFAAKARAAGRRMRVFVGSMMDIADPEGAVQLLPHFWQQVRETADALDYLLLTKRPHLLRNVLPDDWGDGYANVWLGCTAENQQWYEKRWPHMARLPAVCRFVSYEPAIGPLSIEAAHNGPNARHFLGLPMPDWVIAGGEHTRTGPGTLAVVGQRLDAVARPPNPHWFTRVHLEASAYGFAFHFKQWGNWMAVPADQLAATEWADVPRFPAPGWNTSRRLWVPFDWSNANRCHTAAMAWQKTKGGRVLDGATHLGFPRPRVAAAELGRPRFPAVARKGSAI